MSSSPFQRPIWDTLTTRQAQFALGGERARRFAVDIGPLAAARDDDPESLAELGELVTRHGPVLLLQADPIVVPAGLVVTTSATGVQMMLAKLAPVPAPDAPIVPLVTADAPAMLALATLTKPGPFAAHTHELAQFYGIKEGERLIAMAGERMQHAGYSEISGVCVHPDARGRGLARSLSAHVAQQILARGETPYLHAYAANTAAIGLYESLGFALVREMYGAMIDSAPRE